MHSCPAIKKRSRPCIAAVTRIMKAMRRRMGRHFMSYLCIEERNQSYFARLPHTSLVLSEGSLRRRCSCVRKSPASLTTEELLLRRNASHSVSRPWMPKKSCTTIWLCRGVKTSRCECHWLMTQYSRQAQREGTEQANATLAQARSTCLGFSGRRIVQYPVWEST